MDGLKTRGEVVVIGATNRPVLWIIYAEGSTEIIIGVPDKNGLRKYYKYTPGNASG